VRFILCTAEAVHIFSGAMNSGVQIID